MHENYFFSIDERKPCSPPRLSEDEIAELRNEDWFDGMRTLCSRQSHAVYEDVDPIYETSDYATESDYFGIDVQHNSNEDGEEYQDDDDRCTDEECDDDDEEKDNDEEWEVVCMNKISP